MARTQFVIYPTVEQKILLAKASRTVGMSMNRIALESIGKWLKNKKNLRKVSREYEDSMKIMNAKNTERMTGDLLGSYDKKRGKIERIQTAFRNKDIHKDERDSLIKITERDFEITARANKRKILNVSVNPPSVNPNDEAIETELYERNLFDWCKKCSKDCKYCRHYNIKKKHMSQNKALRLENMAIKKGLFK